MQHFPLEYGSGHLNISSPIGLDIRGMLPAPPALRGENAVPQALQAPIQSDSLAAIARQKLQANPYAQAVIVVSDNTRPVPYRGPGGLMRHLIGTLVQVGFSQSQIVVLIGAGSHRNMVGQEIEDMLGLHESGFGAVAVVNHEYEKDDQLVDLGLTRKGSRVLINQRYYEADLKIVTGLVESHFMAGASGGRKGICPGIVGKETLNLFHGGKFLHSAQAADLVLEGNPLHDEALEVAQLAGCDFLVNATIDAEKRITGVFAGDLLAAHQAAVATIREYVVVPLAQRYDIVLVPAGFVGVNHYQAGKAAVEASRAVKPGGRMVIVGKHTDPDPIGGAGYKEALRLLREDGHEIFLRKILQPGWQLIQEQWQVQMWCKVLDVIGSPDHLSYCSLDIPREDYEILPGLAGISLLSDEEIADLGEFRAMELMVERVLARVIEETGLPKPAVLLLKDGPYGIPVVEQ